MKLKTQVIKVSELDEYMKCMRLETEVKVSMTYLLTLAELQLKQMTLVKSKLEYISNFKTKYKFDDDIKQLITPYVSREITIKKLRKVLGLKNE